MAAGCSEGSSQNGPSANPDMSRVMSKDSLVGDPTWQCPAVQEFEKLGMWQWEQQQAMRFRITTKVLAKRMLK